MNRASVCRWFKPSHGAVDELTGQVPYSGYEAMSEEEMRSAVRAMMIERMEMMTYPQLRISADAETAQEIWDRQ
jgi:hypothetical protein